MENKKQVTDDIIVFIVEPYVHGNGGWCGSKVLATMPLKEALSKCPVDDFGSDYYIVEDNEYMAEIRICGTENPNDGLYIETESHSWKYIGK